MTNFSAGKRAREMNRDRKRQEKSQGKADKRRSGPRELPVVTAEEITGNVPSIEEAMKAIENPGSVDRTAGGIRVRLFVGSLADSTTEADLRAVFGHNGRSIVVNVATERGR